MLREDLIRELRAVIQDGRVIEAIARVPRELFVPGAYRRQAWENEPQPIDHGQTISQPFVVARMCELLAMKGDELVLDVGTGSGYHAAVLAELGQRVISIERHPDLVEFARENLAAAGVENVELVLGDGSQGVEDAGPFDAINVAAAIGGEVPDALVESLADGGRMAAPLGTGSQRLVVLVRNGGVVSLEYFEPVRFVPLIEGVE